MPDTHFDHLFRKLLERTATPEDIVELRQLWNTREGADRAEALLSYEDWLQTPAEAPLPVSLREQTLAYILNRDQPAMQVVKRPALLWRRLSVAAVAAVLLLAAGVYLWPQLFPSSTALLLVQAPLGTSRQVALPDGSVVQLNGGSVLQYPEQFDGEQRAVQLEGEAFFEVQRDTAHPFVVRSGNVTTTVLGTSFNVTAPIAGSAIAVAVKTGKVKVAVVSPVNGADESVQLSPGMQAVYDKAQIAWQVSPVPAGDVGGWTSGRLVFQNASLETICAALERRYGKRFETKQPLLFACRYSTRFEGLTLEETLDKLSLLGGLHFTTAGNTITITGTPCN